MVKSSLWVPLQWIWIQFPEPQGGLQRSVTPVLWNMVALSELCGHWGTWGNYIHAGKTHRHKNKQVCSESIWSWTFPLNGNFSYTIDFVLLGGVFMSFYLLFYIFVGQSDLEIHPLLLDFLALWSIKYSRRFAFSRVCCNKILFISKLVNLGLLFPFC